jgi:hypothetical protein
MPRRPPPRDPAAVHTRDRGITYSAPMAVYLSTYRFMTEYVVRDVKTFLWELITAPACTYFSIGNPASSLSVGAHAKPNERSRTLMTGLRLRARSHAPHLPDSYVASCHIRPSLSLSFTNQQHATTNTWHMLFRTANRTAHLRLSAEAFVQSIC